MEKKLLTVALALVTMTFGLRAADSCGGGKCCGGCGPDNDPWHVTSIKWVQDHENDLDKDYKFVALVGKVTQQYDGDTYFFTDGTGTIELDSDIKLPVGENVVIRGEIDQAYLHIGPLEINVESWRHVSKTGEYLK